MKIFDYLVVGSGCSGAMVAQTLVEEGVDIAMLDVGTSRPTYNSSIPDKNFLNLRQTDPEQYRYLLGEMALGLGEGRVGKGSQVTPTRQYMTALTDRYIPIQSTGFSPLESLGYGGLGISWGLQCWEFSQSDLKQSGLSVSLMPKAYEEVSKRIGISATNDGATSYTLGQLKNFQPSAKLDRNHQRLYANYLNNKDKLKRQGFIVGRTPLALLTEKLNGREAYKYLNMDYYSDNHHSAWRPWMTVDALRKSPYFTYLDNQLVTRFAEVDSMVTVYCLDVQTKKENVFHCRKLILASSALGTGRIVLRSLGHHGSKLSLLSNPHSYIPFLQPSLIGRDEELHKLGFGQLSYFIDKTGEDSGLSVASSYSYQSLMLFRIIDQLGLDFSSSLRVMRYLITGIVIFIVQHPDSFSTDKYLRLVEDRKTPTGDKLFINYSLNPDEEKIWDSREKEYIAAMRQLHAYAIKRVKTEHGSSIHYAGTVPFSKSEKELATRPTGQLWGARRVYVADSSGFNYLPAKGLTFSLMANAIIVARQALKDV